MVYIYIFYISERPATQHVATPTLGQYVCSISQHPTNIHPTCNQHAFLTQMKLFKGANETFHEQGNFYHE